MSAIGTFVSDLLAKPLAMRVGDMAVSVSVDGFLTTLVVAALVYGAYKLAKEHFSKKK